MHKVEFVRTGYGKNTVKVLFIRRQGRHHYIIEVKADVQLTLKTRKDYLTGDNSDIIPTDTIKNTVHGLAKLKGVSLTPLKEQDGLSEVENPTPSASHSTRLSFHIQKFLSTESNAGE